LGRKKHRASAAASGRWRKRFERELFTVRSTTHNARPTHPHDRHSLVYTPHVANVDLWKTSGHLEFYKDGMFKALECEGAEYQLKPMNCPFHCMLFKDTPKR